MTFNLKVAKTNQVNALLWMSISNSMTETVSRWNCTKYLAYEFWNFHFEPKLSWSLPATVVALPFSQITDEVHSSETSTSSIDFCLQIQWKGCSCCWKKNEKGKRNQRKMRSTVTLMKKSKFPQTQQKMCTFFDPLNLMKWHHLIPAPEKRLF